MNHRLLAGLLAAGTIHAGAADYAAVRPECELAVNPLGVDVPHPGLAWQVKSDERGQRQTAWQVLVATSLEALSADRGDLWDSGKTEGDRTTNISYAGKVLASNQKVFWKVRSWDREGKPSGWSEPASWTMGLLAADDWKAKWITSAKRQSNLLARREFSVKPGLRRALVHVTGLGQYELFFNGEKAGTDLLSPGWTDYKDTVLYDTRDVTSLVREGANAVGMSLGNGMFHVVRPPGSYTKIVGSFGKPRVIGQLRLKYVRGSVRALCTDETWNRDVIPLLFDAADSAGKSPCDEMVRVVRPPARFAKFVGSFGRQRAILQLRLEYADGSVETLCTDGKWKTHAGPVTFSSTYGGEDFDARLVPSGWKQTGFNDADWEQALWYNGKSGVLRGQSHAPEPIAPIETRGVKEKRELSPGVVLYDFGQNASFIPRIRVSGPAGSVVKLTAGEVVNGDGTIDRATMGGAHRGSAWWQYTKATDGEETWFPQFYYIGSRYLYAESMPASDGGERPKIESVEMVIVQSTAQPAGHFATSDPTLNRIHDLIRWAQRSNMMSILTDCPHREKLGWLEQNHLNGPSLRYEWDLDRLAAKNIRDMAEAQTEDGLIPNIAPEYTVFKGTYRAAAEWGASFIMVPWQQYLFTGDDSLLRDHYDAMTRYFTYLEKRANGGLLKEGLGDWYDVVLEKPGRADLTPPPVTSTAHFYQDAVTLAKIASVLGHSDDARKFSERAEAIRALYNREFFKPGTPELYGTGSQASLAIPLALGIAPPEQRGVVEAALLKEIATRGHFSTGAIGTRYLFQTLNNTGHADLLYKVITNPEVPGYAGQLKQGNTTLAESWTAQRGASQNHFFLGQVMEWFYQDLAGIAPDEAIPGFKHTVIRPQPVDGLEWVEAGHDSVHGPIHVRWEHKDGTFVLKVKIPANTTATIWLPTRDPAAITEGGRAVTLSPGVTRMAGEGDRALFQIESGDYEFRTPL